MSYFKVEVDIQDVIWNMSKWDRKEFFKAMQDEGYISETCVITDEGEIEAPANIERKAKIKSNDDFDKALQKLFGNGWRLTKEEEECIINISKKFI